MAEPNGHVCPECTAPRTPDGTPSCACTQRASDALRDARTAEAAAAEDFDPLRIRPYVELGTRGSTGSGAPAASGESEVPGAGVPGTGAVGAVAPGGAVAPEDAEGGLGAGAGPESGSDLGPGSASGSDLGPESASGSDLGPESASGSDLGPESASASGSDSASTMRLAAVPSDATVRLGAVSSEPRAADVHLFQERSPEPGPPAVPGGRSRPRHRRRAAVLGIAGAVVAVVAAAGLASGLFSYDTPVRDGALPEDVRASVPEVSSATASVAPSESASATASAPAVPAPSHSASPSPSASSSSASATPSPSATPTQTPTTASATGSVEPTRDGSDERRVQTLQRGDRGPEVTELQLRLRQLSLYVGNDDGNYDNQVENAVRRYQGARGITDDEQGVYGAATRTSLESETTEP
ncbi:peptidoglycan-binding protein [Streptomyces sp. NPDC050564]|uniref:peptidoglycan-binding protein n=1 Tax=Streptomyces sp. NPDC050564 TaxID=3365631 RepID=UPI0037B5C313